MVLVIYTNFFTRALFVLTHYTNTNRLNTLRAKAIESIISTRSDSVQSK